MSRSKNLRRGRALTMALLLLGAVACSGGDVSEEAVASAADQTLDASALAALEEAFEGALRGAWETAQTTEEHFPGGTAAFLLPDGTLRSFAVGWSDVDAEVAMQPDMLQPSGSIGKTYVAAVALALAAEGKLDLDAKLETLLGDEPWFSRLPNGPDITVRHLANHTAGLIDHAFESQEFAEAAMANTDPQHVIPPRQLVEFVLDRDPLFVPGEGYHYTDTGYILLGLAIEKAAGATYYDELRRLFLDPLGLDLTLPADQRSAPNLAQGYAHTASESFGTSLEIVGADGLMTIHPLVEWTGGGLYNNPEALVRWGKELYEGRAIDGDYLDELLTVGFSESEELGYGLGVFMAQTPLGLTYGHGGFFPGYNSQLMYFPDHGFAVALQINSDTTSVREHTTTLAQIVADAIESAAAEEAA